MAKILIVEDEKAINDLLKLNLEMVGHQCTPTFTGREAIRAAANKALPTYSQIAKVELVEKPFEKTPKMSIKRYLYH